MDSFATSTPHAGPFADGRKLPSASNDEEYHHEDNEQSSEDRYQGSGTDPHQVLLAQCRDTTVSGFILREAPHDGGRRAGARRRVRG